MTLSVKKVKGGESIVNYVVVMPKLGNIHTGNNNNITKSKLLK